MAFGEQLADGGSAQGAMNVWRVRACPGRCHASARRAVEGVLEAQDLDSQLAWCVLVEDAMGRVRVVVAADSGVVATDDEMRAAVVAPDNRAEGRLPGTGVTHPRRVGGEQHPLRRAPPPPPLLLPPHP